MSDSFNAFLTVRLAQFEIALRSMSGVDILRPPPPALPQTLLQEASSYCLDKGGKRIRPMLCYASASAAGLQDLSTVDYPACSLEILHTYSLVHDDLPAMDDDDLRRGRPSLHKAFDEPTAILVGDGLQAFAFELLAEAPGLSDGQKVEMIKALASAAGSSGMVGGQAIDIAATGSEMTLEQLQIMHSLKTGALIRASLAIGGIATDATAQQLSTLDEFGRHIGLAFQVMDDILDVEGDTKILGKTQGKDANTNKPTYVKLLGLNGAKTEAQRLLQIALDALETFGKSADHLRGLAYYMVQRNH